MDDVGRLVGGRYRIDRELERTPDTQSLLVTDLRNGRPCVLRRLAVATATPAAVRRFAAQGAILAKFDHPGLPHFVDGFTEGEGNAMVHVLVTSYHPGENLERLLAKGRPLTESQALVLLRRLVPVLTYLHAFEPPVVHRTISATGIIIGPDSRPCLTELDFAGAEPASPSTEQTPPGPDELAQAAPEVFMGGAVPASDIYALGLAVCRGMTARDPAVLLREGARLHLRAALGVSEAFAAVVARMLEPSLERRYPDAKALDVDLARLAGVRLPPVRAAEEPKPARVAAASGVPPQPAERAVDEPRPRPRPGARPLVLAGAALGLVVLAALAAVTMRQRSERAPATSLLVSPASQEQAAAPPPEPPGPVATAPPAEPVTPPPAVPGPTVEATVPATAPAIEPATPRATEATPVSPETSAAPLPPSAPAVAPAPSAAVSVDAAAVAEGRLLFDGKPFTDTAAAPPQFWFRKEATKTEVKPQVDHAAGVFTVRGLPPGRYAMSVRINREPGNPNIFPGDLTAWEEFTVEAARPVSLDVTLRTVMHLVQPVDNGVVIRGWDEPCGAGNATPGKAVFSWDALGEGTRYAASVDRLLCGRGYAAAGRVFSQSTTETSVQVDLPPNQEGECYSFRLTANRGGRTVGIMSTHGKTGLGWDYRFTVAK
jgi:hypothetical protein